MKGPGGGGGGEKSLDPQLWHACAGTMVQIPPLNSQVFYFPQGHLEHSQSHPQPQPQPQPQLDLSLPKSTNITNIPPLIPCRVSSIDYLADPETDEVYTKMTLLPLLTNKPNPTHGLSLFDEFSEREEKGVFGNGDNVEKPASFAKTLTQSDANNGGGFSVPRYCAETIFPRLDYTAEPPVQTIVAKDVHGEVWKFRHIYRGTPRRHLLTTGWSTFVNQKKLVAGDSIVFLRSNDGELRVGIRRARRGIMSPEWVGGGNGVCLNPFGGFWKEDETKRNLGLRGKAKGLRVEQVLDAARRAANGQPFEVVYYPRASTPEFFVKAVSVREAMRIRWCPGMRFKMAFETEDSSRISWFTGTVAFVQVSDPIHWPNSPWRLLQVIWDEPDLLQNVKRVNPWLVELVANVPVIHMSPYSPPQKKLRLLQQSDIPVDGQFHLPSYSGNLLGPSSPLCYLTDSTPAGIQGARHAQFGPSLSDLQLSNKLHSGLFLSSFQPFDPRSRITKSSVTGGVKGNEIVSCLLTMGSSNNTDVEKPDNVKKHQFLLFGQPILTEQQISRSHSTDAVSHLCSGKDSFNENPDGVKLSEGPIMTSSNRLPWDQNLFGCKTDIGIGHCKVFMGTEDLGRTLDLTLFSSYEELYRKLANMFGMERSEMLGRLFYRDASGAVKQTGDEPFRLFRTMAKQLTISMNPASNNDIGRTWITGIRNTESGLGASNKAGPLSIFA